jgi:hypothetical protein
MSVGTKTICPICGSEFELNTTGRRKEYCNETCQKANKYLSAFETEFLKIKSITKSSQKDMRSKLMSLANTMNGK